MNTPANGDQIKIRVTATTEYGTGLWSADNDDTIVVQSLPVIAPAGLDGVPHRTSILVSWTAISAIADYGYSPIT